MKKLSRGLKKYIRQEKAKLRWQFSNPEEYRRAVRELYSRLVI
jgi:hypothetical protein